MLERHYGHTSNVASAAELTKGGQFKGDKNTKVLKWLKGWTSRIFTFLNERDFQPNVLAPDSATADKKHNLSVLAHYPSGKSFKIEISAIMQASRRGEADTISRSKSYCPNRNACVANVQAL